MARRTHRRGLIVLAGATLAAMGVWYGFHREHRPLMEPSRRETVNGPPSNVPAAVAPDSPATAAPEPDVQPVVRSPPKKPLPSVTADLSTGRGGYQHDQSKRREYRPLAEQQKLAEIEAVGPAMGLSPETIERLKRWTTAYFNASAAIDEQTVATDDQAKGIQKELFLLKQAETKAWIRLLGDEQSRRFRQLANAFDVGQLEEALHPDPSVPRLPLISSADRRSQRLGSDTSKYDSLFR